MAALIQGLSVDLSHLLSETRRKQSELRRAIETSRALLKDGQGRAEHEVSARLADCPEFITPFVLSCQLKLGDKFLALSLSSFQKLIAARAVSKDSLAVVVKCLGNAVDGSMETQLKILQVLPSIFSVYSSAISGQLLYDSIHICDSLQASSYAAVQSTAAATFSHLVMLQFDALAKGKRAMSDSMSEDTLNLFKYLCILSDGKSAEGLKVSHLNSVLSLELINSILINYPQLFNECTGLLGTVREYLVPILNRTISKRKDFQSNVRAIRIIRSLILNHHQLLLSECELLLTLLLQTIVSETTPSWKKCLWMELHLSICESDSLLLQLYIDYEMTSGHKKVVSHFLEILGKITKDCSRIIDITQASDDLDIDSDHVGFNVQAEWESTMMSSRKNNRQTQLLDRLDKIDAPLTPTTHCYLVPLLCVHAICRSLSSQMACEDKSHGTDNNIKYKVLQSFCETQWPSLLVIFNSLFEAAIDTNGYMELIRAFHELVLVFGKLKLFAPQDVSLNLLVRLTLPSPVVSIAAHECVPSRSLGKDDDRSKICINKELFNQKTQSVCLSERNLIAFRTLIQLSIALSLTLGSSWRITLECVQQIDFLLSLSTKKEGRLITSSPSSNLGKSESILDNQTVFFKTQTELLLQEIVGLPDSALIWVVTSLCNLALLSAPVEKPSGIEANVINSSKNVHNIEIHSLPSEITYLAQLSILDMLDNLTNIVDNSKTSRRTWVLDYICDLLKLGEKRFQEGDEVSNGWHTICISLFAILNEESVDSMIRLRACSIFAQAIESFCDGTLSVTDMKKQECRLKIGFSKFRLFADWISQIDISKEQEISARSTTYDIVRHLMGDFRSLLEHIGHLLKSTSLWVDVLNVVSSIANAELFKSSRGLRHIKVVSPVLELICLEFMNEMTVSTTLSLLDSMMAYVEVMPDVNSTLSVIALFWTISDYLLSIVKQDHATAQFKGEEDIIRCMKKFCDDDVINPRSAIMIWVNLLLRFEKLATSTNSEVRNDVVQVCFRMTESFGELLHSSVWHYLLNNILIPLVERRKSICQIQEDETHTDLLIINNMATLLSQYWELLARHDLLMIIWSPYLSYLVCLRNERESEKLSIAIFGSLWKLLDTILASSDNHFLEDNFWQIALAAWFQATTPIANTETLIKHEEQIVLTESVKVLIPLQQLIGAALTIDNVESLFKRLYTMLTEIADLSATYDVDYMTPLQAGILRYTECLINCHPEFVKSSVYFLASVCTLASQQHNISAGSSATFIALARTVMPIIAANYEKHTKFEVNRDWLASLSENLLVLISHTFASNQNVHMRDNSAPHLRLRQLTATTLGSMYLATPLHRSSQNEEVDNSLLDFIRTTLIVKWSSNEPFYRPEEEIFDSTLFIRLKEYIQLQLNSSPDKNNFGSMYCQILFEASFFYTGDYENCKSFNVFCKRLDSGSTTKNYAFQRLTIAELAFDQLCLIAKDDIHVKEKNLNDIALDFLVRRCAYCITKFITDQPLRGCLPMQFVRRKELLLILDAVKCLNPHFVSKYKHFELLRRLICEAMLKARFDRAILSVLNSTLCAMNDYGRAAED